MTIQVLGTGCPKCQQLTANVEAAAQELGIDYDLEKVTDILKIIEFGVKTTPVLVVDGKVKLAGVAASPAEIRQLLK